MIVKIPSDLEPEIVAKAGQGWSMRKIADWLASEHGVQVSHQAVNKHVIRVRAERADISKAVVREALAPQVLSDLDYLATHQKELHELAMEMRHTDPELYIKAVEQLRKITDTKLHYSGADTPDDSLSELAAAHERVQSRLARLAATESENGGNAADRPN